jgi:pyridoxamine 5'-phosphate oxidase family protein
VIGRAGNMARSKKFRDAWRSPDVAVVVDDLASVDPWRPRGIEIRGRAETHTEGGGEEGERLNASFPFQPAWIRIAPRRILAWGIDRNSFELTARDVAARGLSRRTLVSV